MIIVGSIPAAHLPAPEDKVNVSDMRKPASDVAGIEEVSTLQTQVDNSAVGTNLIVQSDLKMGYIIRDNGGINNWTGSDFHSDNYIPTNGATVFTLSSPDYVFKGNINDTLSMYDSNKKYLGYQIITSATQTLSKPNAAYIRLSINFVVEGGISGHLSDWLANHRYKLEKGSKATDWCPNPEDKVNVADMRKRASDVAGIEEVNTKQDKIGYTPADDSKVVHDNHDNTIKANNVNYDLSKTGLKPISLVNSGSFNDLPLGTVYAPSWLTDGPNSHNSFVITTFYFTDWGGIKTQIAIANSTNLMYFRVKIGTSWNSWVLVSDDSKVVHSTDMRKPASDVAGIEEVNAKQDKIGYTPADDSKVVHSTDASNWQKQAMFNPGSYNIDGTTDIDFATLLRTKYNKPGVVYIRDNTSFVDAVVICEGSGWWHAYGEGGDGNFVHRRIRESDDTGWVKTSDDSKVAHLSGANNFDTVPTVDNNPLLLASSLPSDLARTGSNQEFTGNNTFDTAPIDKTTGNPYITKDGVPSLPSDLARTGQDANFTAKLQKNGQDVALANNTLARNPDTGKATDAIDFDPGKLTIGGNPAFSIVMCTNEADAKAKSAVNPNPIYVYPKES